MRCRSSPRCDRKLVSGAVSSVSADIDGQTERLHECAVNDDLDIIAPTSIQYSQRLFKILSQTLFVPLRFCEQITVGNA